MVNDKRRLELVKNKFDKAEQARREYRRVCDAAAAEHCKAQASLVGVSLFMKMQSDL